MIQLHTIYILATILGIEWQIVNVNGYCNWESLITNWTRLIADSDTIKLVLNKLRGSSAHIINKDSI